MSITVASLRAKGHKVRVTHFRCYEGFYIASKKRREIEYDLMSRDEFEKKNSKSYSEYVLPFGGKTVVEVSVNGRDYVGVSHCSVEDNFKKKVGASIALGRALKDYVE